MKKILVVLLILAVAGGVFAQQGSWSISGSADVGVRVDFDPIPGVKAEDEAALVQSIGYQNWNQTHGDATLGYSNEGLWIGLTWNTRSGEGGPEVSYNGDNYKFTAATNLSQITDSGSGDIGRLWGEFLFLNGLISVEAAYNSRDNGDGTWTSDLTGAFRGFGDGGGATINGWTNSGGIRTDFFVGDPFAGGESFAKFDHPSLLMANVNLDAISFGIQTRNLFDKDGKGIQGYAYYNWQGASTKFVDNVIKESILGLKFAMSPLEFAAQFRLKQYGVYFGGKFFAGPVTLGLSFMGNFQGAELEDGTYDNDKRFKFGGDIGYNSGAFGGGISAFYDRQNDPAIIGDYGSIIAVMPRLFYNAIPSHLRFAVNTGFYFLGLKVGESNESDLVWAVQPELSWNFRGTGATDYFWGGSGVIVRYRLVSAFDATKYFGKAGTFGDPLAEGKDGASFLDLVFKWSFF